jgi:hypothetical protein
MSLSQFTSQLYVANWISVKDDENLKEAVKSEDYNSFKLRNKCKWRYKKEYSSLLEITCKINLD